MRLSSMARQRIITLLGLTSLVVMMVTISRFTSSFSHPTAVRLISQQKLYEYQKKLRLIASEHNSNNTLNNLLENLIQTKIHSKLNSADNIAPVVLKSIVNTSSSSPLPAPPQSLIQSAKLKVDHDNLVSNNNNANIETVIEPKLIDSHQKALKSGSKTTATEEPKTGPDLKSAENLKQTSNQNINKNSVENNMYSKSKFDINLVEDQKSVQNNQKLQQLDNLENNENKLTKIRIKPKLVFDSEDLKTTETMKIDKPLGCDDDMGASLDLLVIVNSAVTHWEARSAVRETWGKFAVERGATLFFLIGSTTDSLVQEKVEEEEKMNGDLLQGNFIDNYFNLTLKTISMMKWISEHCSKVKYVLKVDDDMFVNMQHIADFTETRTFTKCIIGKLAKKWKPHRTRSNKWYVPVDAFNGTIFPSFATGPAYMVSGDAVQPLYEWSIKLKPFYLEDVYMTGIVAERAHIRRLNHAMMTNVHIKGINPCNFPKFMTSHKHSPNEIRRLWQLVYSQPSKPCPTPKPTIKPADKSVNKNVTPPKSRPVPNAI